MRSSPWRYAVALRLLQAGAALLLLAQALLPNPAWAGDAASLRARHAALQEALQHNAFDRPLHIESTETGDTLRGQVHAVLEHPFTKVRDALREPPRWCDILILPFNTKYCHAVKTAEGPALLMRIGRKADQPVESAYRLSFAFQSVAADANYFESRLAASEGPIGTRNYRITVSAIPLGADRTFLSLDYSYGFGATGRVAMQLYLSTVGASKVGFSPAPGGAGPQEFIGGMRGAVERNAMRYYLAIDAYLDSLSVPEPQQLERR
ncbi:MAG TPA: hypothetical protein VLJ86_07790, partial [Ramlibacter sp.]|nr:hypothetical protein [Ramlibacter sp.]